MELGNEILVNGVRPAWIGDTDKIPWRRYVDGHTEEQAGVVATGTSWRICTAIRLPADHWAYRALDAGFEPWAGGNRAPEDFLDGDDVLLEDGRVIRWHNQPAGWPHCGVGGDIIGYRKKKLPDTGNTVTLTKMTEAEIVGWMKQNDWNTDSQRCRTDVIDVFRDLGLIREETLAEKFSRETGHPVTAAVEAALTWGRAE